ncbi:DoxX family membrane protein [Echinicola marina]|uniref:BT_3928 family protein n=1 Tax=Echinicola marina TaxID=2859768 RepID=UPI001CF64E82|nr:BT_3928 family protein [Echinicola marina]UCS93584.1 DoxX family membrane protein [Echinicola marina]
MLKKIILNLFRFLVGGLFVFSGLIKVNDPVGTSIKLKEYFEVFSQDIAGFFKVFIPYSLTISVVLIVLEVVLGVMLIFNVKKNLTVNFLLLLIVFFTFLTFYSAYFNKVTDCGCFGDAIKLTPWQSFYKDIVLLVLIGVLFLFKKDLLDSNGKWAKVVVMLSFLGALLVSIYAIRNLPIIDFRAYKEGVNIQKAMQPSGTLEYRYIMSKDGKEVILDEYPTDESYEFVDMQLKNPEFLPKISDFAVWTDQGDFTDLILEGNKVLVLFNNLEKVDKNELDKITPLVNELKGDIEVLVITASSAEEIEGLLAEKGWDIPYYYGDATVVKTMIRSNPGIILIQEGTIVKKYHINNTPQSEEVKSLLSP